MSHRENVYVCRKVLTEGTDPEQDEFHRSVGLPNPNRYVGMITAEIRVFFPPHTRRKDVISELRKAYADALRQLRTGETGTVDQPDQSPELPDPH